MPLACGHNNTGGIETTMTQSNAVGISTGISTGAFLGYGGGPSATSLQAQLQRYEKQLSECVNCESAKTPQGKADIQAISARISQLKESIAQTDKASASRAVPDAPAPAASANAGPGQFIDVFA
ncbi:FlxA-like family protein [Massilia rhizosphaerae]|uniref:FlxA-like family protein n=1 Tax=Massilia rhizosphaerae TaxID=2784389 RepID=UPI0018DCB566|nr:FlxA-like family protein [Massilia rhizosphaerae]